MRRTLLPGPLVVVLYAVAWSQTLTEYAGIGATSAAGASKTAGTAAKAVDVLGKRLGESLTNPGAPRQLKPSSSPEDLMRSNRRTLEQAAGKRGAMLHVTCVPPGATLFVDHRAVAHAPAGLLLPAGKHILELKSPAFLDWNHEVSVSAGEKLSFELKLQGNQQELQENKQAQSGQRIINLQF